MKYIKAKTIITKNKPNSWFNYDYNMNIYRGCNHGCIYCDSRANCYKINDFETIRAKQDALRIIRDDLKRTINPGVICTGAMSDPYNIFEKELNLTRYALELIHAYDFGVGIITKSDLITRDIDILKDISQNTTALVKITITTANDELAKKIEPNAPLPSKRFEALKKLSEAGIFAGVLLMPVLPFIQDNEENIKEVIEKAAESGAKFIYPRFGVTLRGNQKEYFFNQLDKSFPNIKEKYLSLYQGKIYYTSPNSRNLHTFLKNKCKEHNLMCNINEIIKESQKKYKYPKLSVIDIANLK